MTDRERGAFLALADAVCAPAPPLPPVAATGAVAAFEHWLAAAPRRNRVALRAALAVLARRSPHGRTALLDVLRRLGALGEGLRVCAAGCYYADPAVLEVLGYARR